MTCSGQNRVQTASRDSKTMSLAQQWSLRLHCLACEECRAEQAHIRHIETSLPTLAQASTPPHVYAALLAQLPELNGAELPLTLHEDVVLDKAGVVSRRRVRKRWAVAAVVGLAVAIGGPLPIPSLYNLALVMFGRYWEQKQDQNQLNAQSKFMNAAVRDPGKYDAGSLAKVKEMRARWKPWAIRHKPELQQLLKTRAWPYLAPRPAAVKTVYDLLPATLPQTGAGLTQNDLSSSNRWFTWQPDSKINKQTPNRLLEDFVEFQDIALSRSDGFSSITYTLWVSGRITAQKNVSLYSYSRLTPYTTHLTCQILPPYEELTTNP